MLDLTNKEIGFLTVLGYSHIHTQPCGATDLGIRPSAILSRLSHGWSTEDALTTPRTKKFIIK